MSDVAKSAGTIGLYILTGTAVKKASVFNIESRIWTGYDAAYEQFEADNLARENVYHNFPPTDGWQGHTYNATRVDDDVINHTKLLEKKLAGAFDSPA